MNTLGKNEDPEKKRARQARYRERNRAKLAEKQCKYRQEKPEIDREYRSNNKEHIKATRAKRSEQKKKIKWQNVRYIGIDGEAHREENGRSVYSYLRAGQLPPLVRREGLNTKEILEYLFRIPPGVIVCGFVLNYDWENWLKDIPDDAYKYLTGDGDIMPGPESTWERVIREDRDGNRKLINNTICWEGYTISYFPRKIFTVQKPGPGGKTWQRKVMDVWGYCQSSFLKACEAWGVASKEGLAPVAEGKARRDVFSWNELDYIAHYNSLELDLMEKLARAIFQGIQEACEIAELPITPSPYDLYGPGALARKLLKKTGWPVNLGRTSIPARAMEDYLESVDMADSQQKEYLQHFPIISSYYGGRIEASATGRWKKVYDYDLHSAYPSAIVRLPFWPGRMTWKRFLDPDGGRNWARAKRALGMYYVMWHFPRGWNWYPFPTRQKKYQNVYYPQNGQGWIASPELFAALDTIPDADQHIKVYYAWTRPGKYGYGGGERPLPEDLKSEIALLVEQMYNVRAEAKKLGKNGAQLALKLILNSMYGKLLQQIGVTLEAPGHFHDLVASWITSWTRAMIYRAIAPHRKGKTVIAIQTDGIVTKKRLDLPLSPALADWEVVALPDYRQLLPGLYDYQDGDKRKERRRGMPSTFDWDRAWAVMDKPGQVYTFTYRTFLGRRLYLAQPYQYEGMLYQWPEMEKTFRPDLGAKRGDPWADKPEGMKFGDCYLDGKKDKWLPPKRNLLPGPGLPFILKFDEPSHIPIEDWEIEQAKLEDSMDESPGFFRE